MKFILDFVIIIGLLLISLSFFFDGMSTKDSERKYLPYAISAFFMMWMIIFVSVSDLNYA